jgi:hypothetical protein
MPTLTPSDNSRGNSNDTLMAGVMNLMGTVLAMAMRPKETDPLLLALINNLATNNKPQPPLDATAQLVQLSEVVKNLQGNNGGSGSSNQMLEMLMRERMSPADVLGLVNQVKGERGTDDLKKSVENLGFLLNTVQQLRSHTEPSGGSGFWDAVNSIFANPGLASAIGSKVRSIGDGAARPVQALPAHTQTPAQAPPRDPLALKARELTARKMRIEEMQIVEAERRLGLAAPPPASPQLPPIPTATAAVAVAVEEPGEPGPLATPNGEGVTLPPRITDHLNSYMTARDDGDIVATTIELIFSLKEDEKWQPYSEVIVGCILKNDRASFMQYMSSLLVSLRHIGMLDDALAHKISDTLQKHFSVIVEETTKRMVAEGSPADSTEEDGEGDGDPEGDDDDGGEEDPDDLLQIS